MAHNLTINKQGTADFFTVKEKAWHGLGTVLEQCPTSEEAIKIAGLDFNVDLSPVYAHVPAENGSTEVLMPDNFATYRTDNNKVFGLVGDRYTPVQNIEAFSFMDGAVGGKEAVYETAGSLLGGAVVFITLKVPGYIKVNGQDVIEKYLILTMRHDGKGCVKAFFSPIRVVCNNTLSAALSMAKATNETQVSIRHTKTASDKLAVAHRILGITNELADNLEAIFGQMSAKKVSDKQAEQYFEKLVLGETKENRTAAWQKMNSLPSGALAQSGLIITDRMPTGKEMKDIASTRAQNIIDGMNSFYHTHPTQKIGNMEGTAYGVYQAVTGYYQNVKNFKDAEAKMLTNMLGNNSRQMQVAFDLAYAL